MKTVILVSLLSGFLGIFFIYFMYVVISVVFSLVKNIGKDKFIWYGQPLERSYARLVPYDSFMDMLKGGIKMTLHLAAVGVVLVFIVCTCLAIKGEL